MDAKELRIGNLVMSNDKHCTIFPPIDGIMEKHCHLKYISGFSDYSSLQGIPLTKEWIEKLGIKYAVNAYLGDCFEDEYGIFYVCDQYGIFYVCDHTEDKRRFIRFKKKVEFVHQLQNLYFELNQKPQKP